ncbi:MULTISPECIES: glutathione S-transferase family protein [Pseudomonas]|uniref:Glutathione S-transferase n=1 Tax=Pseudomonas quercus TaxID=2722792 RepID=A0ABX0YKK3_9PSED|nr:MULTISPECIES: glutathione S-transferase [Pseudomonas]MBF7144202.1 glutathione S-transferase [Pseudomonas sp. LY10J]NJP02666.1 glutathione S-transferase [Pseudomonas quercus]
MRKILGRSSSINVRKVLWACTELRLPFEHDSDWGLGFRSPKASEFLALNPNAQIPVLVENDFVLWESNSILRYLANGPGQGMLYPQEPRTRARVDQWLDWQAAELNPSWSYVFHSIVRNNPDYQDPDLLRQGQARWAGTMAILDRQLTETGAFVTGKHFTLADIAIGLSVNRWLQTPFERPAFSAVSAYQDRLNQREGYVRYSGEGQP